ncbi:MAG: hypothetical protein PVJ27_06795 [Candidatus Brocadiaceae bacterium]|jgi:hypothetical protein
MTERVLRIDEENRAAGPSCGQVRIAEPMTPRTLEALGVPRPFPPAEPGFAPDGDWTQTYRIWGGHGWIDCCYKTVGVLRLQRERIAKDAGPGDGHRLRVEQRIIYEGGIVHTIEAEAASADDTMGSLRRWTVRSEVTTTSGEPDPRLRSSQEGQVNADGRSWQSTVSGVRETTRKRPLDGPLTSDWSLIEAVQRLPFAPIECPTFHLLEGMTMPKRGFRLYHRETPEEGLKEQDLPLHRFYLIGRGQLPTDYWVDDHHRLIMAVSGSRALFLDDDAETPFQASLEYQRAGKGYYHE